MDPSVQNLLYRNPQYYELVYPEPDEETPEMCRRMFGQFLPALPKSILDLGCGTGRDLATLSRTCPDCWGVDCLPEMIQFAEKKRPMLHLRVGDMRTVRLGRAFDVVLCMGSALMYAWTNDDVARAFSTFAAHAHPRTLLVLDINNAASYLIPGGFRERTETEIKAPGFTARTVSHHRFDLRRQLLVRERTWHLPGQPTIEDFCQYRLFFPAELENLLANAGFDVLGMYDNMGLNETDLSGSRLYVAASYVSK